MTDEQTNLVDAAHAQAARRGDAEVHQWAHWYRVACRIEAGEMWENERVQGLAAADWAGRIREQQERALMLYVAGMSWKDARRGDE